MGEPRRALVTGTSTGLGLAIALALAREGYELALTELDIVALAEPLRHPDFQNRKVVPIKLDLSSQQSIEDAFGAAREQFGDLDLLVNNAGRALIKQAVDVTAAEWDDILDTNLKGSFFLAQQFGRYCIDKGHGGAIVSMASTHGMTGIADRLVYGISKAGIIQMTRMLAIEWAPHNIRVNAVAPGTVLTPSRAELLNDPANRDRMLARIPSGRFIMPDEVAAAVVYLASPAAASVTGHTLVVDGGITVV
jgi:NAD(P)-dependent dehydrogenase (short-subunit alcohol dehydrogenase family)